MSLTWESIGDTKAAWKYGIITGTGTLTSTIVDNLLDTTEISNQVFDDISNGTQIGIKVVGYTTLGDNAFNPGTVYTAIQYLYDVILDTNLTTIGSQVLSSGSIDSITIPPTVTSISRFAFNGSGIAKIYVDDDNDNYSSGIMKATWGDYEGVLYNKDGTELIIYPPSASMSTIIIPEGVTTIKKDAFYGHSSVNTITLASTITTIEDNAFYNCYMLDEVFGLRSSMTIGSNAFQYTGVKEAFDIAKTINDRSQTTGISYVPSSAKEQDSTTQTYDVVTTVTKQVSEVEYDFGYSTRNGPIDTTVTWTWQETVQALEAVENRDPTGSVTIDGIFEQNKILTAVTSELVDADGLGVFSYQWNRDGNLIIGETSQTYTLTQDDVGSTITVTVSYTDQRGFAESVTSSSTTTTVANVNDLPSGKPQIVGTTSKGSVLIADTDTIIDADGVGLFYYQWKRAGSAISGATNQTYTLTQADVDSTITVTVTYTDQGGQLEEVTSDPTGIIANVNRSPSGKPTITGIILGNAAKQGDKLTADTSQITDADGLGSFSYQWNRDGTTIDGVTSSTYTLTQDDVGKKVSVTVTYTDGGNVVETLTSDDTSTVDNVNDLPKGKPIITNVRKILCLHGGGESVNSFSNQTGIQNLQTSLSNDYIFEFLSASDDDNTRGIWWNDPPSKDQPTDDENWANTTIEKINQKIINDGPYYGLLGYSQGAAACIVWDAFNRESENSLYVNKILLFCGYLPTTHNGLTTVIDRNAPSNTRTLIFLGEQDVNFYELGKAIKDKFNNSEEVRDSGVGHYVPTNSDNTYNDVLNFITEGTDVLKEDDVLGVDTSGIEDDDGIPSINSRDDVTFTYLWSNGKTKELIRLTQEDVGNQMSVTVSYTDSQGVNEDVTSDPTNTVANVNDDPVSSFTFSISVYNYATPNYATPEVLTFNADGTTSPAPRGPYSDNEGFTIPGDTLSYSFTVTDEDDLTDTFEYKWYNDNGVIENATSTSYTLTANDIGKQVYAEITYTDGQNTVETLTSQKIAVISVENNSVQGTPVLSGEAKQNEVLTASVGTITDADGINEGTISYIWFRDDDEIVGKEEATYTLTQEDVGKKITVKVSYRDSYSRLETSKASNEIGPIENVNDPLTGELTINVLGGNGKVEQYQTLMIDVSKLIDLDGIPSEYTIKWFRDDVEITELAIRESGEPEMWVNKKKYTLSQEDVGKKIKASISYTQSDIEHSVTSPEYGPVKNVNDPPTGEIKIVGTPKEGETLTAVSTLEDKDGLGILSYQWFNGETAIDAIFGTSSTYTLVRADVNKEIKVQVKYTDGGLSLIKSTEETVNSSNSVTPTLVFQSNEDMKSVYNEWYENSTQTTTKYGLETTWSTENIQDFSCVFNGRVVNNHPDISKWNTSNAINMDGLFSFSNFNQEIKTYIENENIYWDMSNVQSTIGMFYGNLEFDQDISNWFLPSLRTAQYMFSACKFNQNIQTNSLDTTVKTYYEGKDKIYMAWDMERVEDMRYMFANNLLFNQPISNWSTYQAKLEGMFYNAMVFNQLIGEKYQFPNGKPEDRRILLSKRDEIISLMKQIHVTLVDLITDLPDVKSNFIKFLYTQIPSKLVDLHTWIREVDIDQTRVIDLYANCCTIAHNIVGTCNAIMKDITIDKEKFTPYYNQLVDYCYGKDGFKGKLSFYVAWYTGSVENMNHFLHNARLYNRGIPHENTNKQDIIKKFANEIYYKRNENEELKVRYGDKVSTYKKDSTVDGQYKLDSTTDVGLGLGSDVGSYFGSVGFDDDIEDIDDDDDDDDDDSGFTITYNGSDFTTSTGTFDIAETLSVSYENKKIEINTSKGNTYSLTMYSYNKLDNNANLVLAYTVAPFDSILDTLFLRYSNACTEDNFSAFTTYIANSILKSNSTLLQQTERSEEEKDLTGENFSNKELTRTNYTGATLNGTNFTNANLIRANFAETKMNSETNFTDATLNEVKSGGITMSNGNEQPILPDGYKLIDGYIMGPYVDVSKTGGLESSNLENMNLRGVNLEKNNLTNAKLDGVKSRFIKSDDQTALPENYVIKDGFLLGPKVDLVRENLSNLDLTEANLTEANSEGANFSNTKLNDVNFTQTNLKQANLRGANLTNAQMDSTDIRNADLRDVTFTNTRGENIIFNNETQLPSDYVILKEFLFGPGVNLKETVLYSRQNPINLSNLLLTGVNFESAKLSYANLTNTTLKDANLKGADLDGALMKETDLTGADLSEADLEYITSENIVFNEETKLPEFYKIIKKHLVGPSVKLGNIDFEDVDFRGTSLQGASLQGANLKGANLSGVDLSGAYLNNVTSGNIISDTDTKISDRFQLLNGYLIGPTVDIEGEDIGPGILSNLDLEQIKIAGANLSGLMFYNVKTKDIKTYSGVQLSEQYKIFGDSIIGPGVDISYEREDFKNADLTNMRLIDTNFNHVNFLNATLTGLQTSGIQEGLPNIKLPDGYSAYWQPENRKTYIIGPDVDLTNMDLRLFNLRNFDFDGISSGGNINSSGTELADGYFFLENTDSEDHLFGPKVKLVGKNLVSNESLYPSQYFGDVTKSMFDNTILYNSDFSLSTFGVSGSLIINQAILSDVKFTNGKILGTINDSTLTGADFSGTDASQATFKEIISGNITVNENTKLPPDTYIRNGYMICYKAVLAGAELPGEDLSNVNLEFGNLTNANLTGVSFKGANLKGADFDQADMTGANIEGADLTEASLFEVISDNIVVNFETKLPSGYRIVDRKITKIDSTEED